jgi:hypothetical protein
VSSRARGGWGSAAARHKPGQDDRQAVGRYIMRQLSRGRRPVTLRTCTCCAGHSCSGPAEGLLCSAGGAYQGQAASRGSSMPPVRRPAGAAEMLLLLQMLAQGAAHTLPTCLACCRWALPACQAPPATRAPPCSWSGHGHVGASTSYYMHSSLKHHACRHNLVCLSRRASRRWAWALLLDTALVTQARRT